MTLNVEMRCLMIYLGLWLGCISSSLAQLQWESRELEFKPSLGETHVVAHFKFTNTGSQKITISNIQTSCDCTKAELAKKIYQPGEQGEIVVQFDMTHRFGLQQKQIIVQTDLEKDGLYILHLKVAIPELLFIKPQILLWKQGEAIVSKTVQIQVAQTKPVEITKVLSTIPEFTCELKVLKPGSDYELKVTPTTTAKILTGQIQIETDFKSTTPLNFGVHTLIR